jgi:DNA-binding SARP family transcriptional activator
VEFRILGPLEVVDGDRPLSLGGPKQRALLALLLTRANEVVPIERLVDELWRETPPKAAVNTIQYYVSQLRKVLGPTVIVTQPPGYVVRVEVEALDLRRFERLFAAAQAVEPARAATLLREALELWRGPPLGDVASEGFARPEIARLEELRLAAVEARIAADLECGRHSAVTGDLEALVLEHPLRERLRAQLMLALYRSGRQAEALEAYAKARRVLDEQLGLEPGPELQRLQKAILVQDLDLAPGGDRPRRSILVVGRDDSLFTLAESLAQRPARELIVTELVADSDELLPAASLLNDRCGALRARGATARSAIFTSASVGEDLARLAAEQDVDLVLVEAREELLAGGPFPLELNALLTLASADVAILAARPLPDSGPILVPFGGGDDDWAAVEVAAWAAAARGQPLRLVGARDERGDASRLLAKASLVVQRAVGIPTEPLVVAPGADEIAHAAVAASLLVVGLSRRWRQEGLGPDRLVLAREARPPALFVRRGIRPSGIASAESATRFTWSLSRRA